MSYQIPPPLQHKEKIIFGMTFSQLAYALPAFLLIFLIIFKTNLPIQFTGTIATVIALVTSSFIFFDAKNKLQNLINHFLTREVEVNSDKLKQIVNIDKVKGDEVIQSNSKISILEVTPFNFLIKSEEEQESIIKQFQKFLNSIDFPVQIHISSSTINLDKHFHCLEQKTKLHPKLFQSYKDFTIKSIKTNNIKNRKFYIIIKETENLKIQTKVCQDKLNSLGLKVTKLNEKQLVNLFYDNIADKKEKQLQENQEIDNYLHFLLSPKKLIFNPDNIQTDDNYLKILTVTGYPNSVELNFLDKIISSGENYDISLHIEPFQIETTMLNLNRDLQKQQADLYADTKKGILNPSLEIKYKSTKKVLEDLQKGKQKLFNVSLYIMCKSKNKQELDLLTKKVKADLDGLMIQSSVPKFRSMEAYESMLPLGKDALKIKRNIHTEGLSAFFPFSSPFLNIDNDGIMLGLNKNKIPYIKNIYKLTNANGIILATSGAGKSYFTKLLISRQFLNGSDVIIIDPQGEYLAITQHYKGETITISRTSETIINPLDLMGHDYLEKRLSLMDLFQIMFGDITEIQKAIMDKAVDLTYGKKGINANSYKGKVAPKIQDLYNTLVQLEKSCASIEKSTYRALLNRLGMYAEGGVFSFLNKDTNINFSNKFVCFNIGHMPKQVKPVVMYLVLDYVYTKMKGSLNRKLLVIDEAWAMLQTAEESSYIFEIVKTCRKYNLGLLMITQDVADLVASRAGHAVLANTSYTFLLRQKPAVMSNVMKTFNLSQMERDFLISAERGSGVLILENEHEEIEVIASPLEHKLITTNPDEINENKKVEVKGDDINIKLDVEKDVHAASGLSIEERNFLVNNGYKVGRFHSFADGGPKTYFVKDCPPEGITHVYYSNLLYGELKKHTEVIERNYAKRPDIIFTDSHGKIIAIEVESGINVKDKSKKRYHDQKFENLKKEFGDNCYIFVYHSDLKNSYTRHEIKVLLRKDFVKLIKGWF